MSIYTSALPNNGQKKDNGKTNEALLRLGDEIIFHDYNNNVLTAQNPLETRACVRPDSSRNAMGTTVFRIEPQQSYAAQRELENFIDRDDYEVLKSKATREELKHLVFLEQKAAKETAQNESERDRLLGKPVLYGQIVQLFNRHFNKYLTVTGKTQRSSTHQNRLQVDLSNEWIGYFRIVPRYRIKYVGDTIRIGETIALQSVRPEGFLNVDYSKSEDGDEYQVFSHTQTCSWGMKLHYSPITDQDAKRVKFVNSGQYIRLYHKEIEAYLEAPAINGDTVILRKHTINPLNPKENDSPLAFWEIENLDTSGSSKVRWKKSIRIRHVVSRAYLSIDPTHVRIDVAKGRTTCTLKLVQYPVVPIDVNQDTTLFELTPISAPTISSIPYGSMVRIKHVATGCWLHAPDSQEDTPQAIQTTQIHSSPINVAPLTLSPLLGSKRHSRFESTESSFTPLVDQAQYVEPLDAAEIMGNHWSPSATYHSISASHDFYYHDCFSITLVDQKMADKFNFVNEMVPTLHRYLSKNRFSEKEVYPIQDDEFESVSQVLGALIHFCTISKQDDPLKREGLPIVYHQALLKDVDIATLLVNIIMAPFDHKKRDSFKEKLSQHQQKKADGQMSEKEVSLEDLEYNPKLKKILKLAYHLLRAFLNRGPIIEQDSSENEEALERNKTYQLFTLNEFGYEGINLLIRHLNYGLGASDVLNRLLEAIEYKNMMSQSVLDSLVEKTLINVQHVVDALRSDNSWSKPIQKTDFSCIRLLSAVCYRAVAPTRANTTATSLLLRFRDRLSEDWFQVGDQSFIRMRLKEQGEVEIKICNDIWRDLESLSEIQPNIFSFVEDALDLAYSLSSQTNTKISTLISECISKEVCFQCLKNKKLPPTLRGKFCDLLRVLYVDNSRLEKVPLYDYTIYIESIDLNSDQYPFGSSNIDSEFFQSLKHWIFGYLETQFHQYIESSEDVRFLSCVLKLIHVQLTLGFFHTTEDIAVLFHTLIQVLDGRTDARSEEHRKYMMDANMPRKWPERYELAEKKQMVMSTKIQILYIFDLIFDLRLRVRMSKLAQIWKWVLEDESAEYHTSPDSSGLKYILQVFDQTELRNREESLMPILKDMLKYQYAPLKHIAVVVMHRIFTDSEELFKKVKEAVILTEKEQHNTYLLIKDQLNRLQTLNLVNIENEEQCLQHLSRLKDSIETLEKLLIVPLSGDQVSARYDESIYYRIFKSLDAHDILVGVLKSLQNIPAPYYHAYVASIVSCLRLLYSTMQHDKQFQSQFVLNHMDLLIELIQLSPLIAEIFALLCSSNSYISTHIKEEHITRIITASEGHQGEHLLVLHDLLYAQGKLVKRNQDIVMRFFMDHRHEFMPFDNAESLVHMHNSDYCINLISILATCGQGENMFGQSFARTVLTIQDIFRILHDSQVNIKLKAVILKFLASIYIEDVELPSNVLAYDSPDMLRLITMSEVVLSQCLSGKHDEEFLRYIFHGIITFLKSIFEYHISIETVVDLEARFTQLVDQIVKLVPLAAHEEKDLQLVLGCLDSMINVAGFRGTIQPILLRDTIKDATSTLDQLYARSQHSHSNLQGSDDIPVAKFVPIQDTANISFQKLFSDIEASASVKRYQKDEYRRLCSHFALSESDSDNNSNIKSLIVYLGTITTTSVNKRTEQYQVATIQLLKEISMKYIRKLWKINPNESLVEYEKLERQKVKTQNTLNDLGCTLVAQHLLSSPRKQIFNAALKLLISLLDGGNKNVQDKLEEYFYSIREERFFYSFHQRLQSGISASKDMQIYLARRMYKMNRQQYVLENLAQQRKKTLKKHKRDSSANFLDPNSLNNYKPILKYTLAGQLTHQEKEANAIYREITQIMVASNDSVSMHNSVTKDLEVTRDAMRALQLMVEGHNLHLQTYLAKQPDNIKSFNIVLDVVEYFHAIVPLCNQKNIDLIIQVVDTITELAQGCLENQVTIFNNKIVNPVNVILREPYIGCDIDKVNELKSKVVICLLSLLEGGIENSETLYREMVESLDLSAVKSNMELIYNTNLPNLKSFEKLECGFLYCILIMTLHPALDPDQAALFLEDNKAFEYFQSHTGKIEILMDYGQEKQLTRVLFPIPEICRFLRKETRQRFLWNAKRESPSSKIEDFVQQSEIIIFEIENQAHISSSPYLSLLTMYSAFWWESAYGVTVLLNMLLMMYPNLLEVTLESKVHLLATVCRYFLGLLHLVLWLLLTTEFYLIRLPVLINRRYGSLSTDFISTFKATITESRFLYHIAMVVLSVVGLFYPGFYSVHLLDLLFRDSVLQGVISSITLNIHSISRTALLGIIVIYIHSIIAYMYFRTEFDTSKGLFCGSLSECFITVLSHGVRSGGGIGDILEPDEHMRPSGWRTVFEMSFYLVVVVFLLNVIFGIIFDTFGHLRDERSSIQQDMKDSCFICSIPAVEFQRHTKKGFEDHVKNDHNIWQYLFFLVHLRNKDPTEYTGPESYVATCLRNGDYSCFPINKALGLKKEEQDDDERLEKLEETNQLLIKKLGKLEEQLEKLNENQSRSRQNSLMIQSFS
ncbi:hypothetical protein EDC96DRAFT_509091 [Choanephora cucurbitarum]|nr:hypothetical protein EDC96DRAFT_509091 [Choanephora cucurbitarum]